MLVSEAMDTNVSVIDLVTMLISLSAILLSISCGFYCYIRCQVYMAAQAQIGQALVECHKAIIECDKRSHEGEEAYLDVIRNIYRIDKTVGSLAGDVLGIDQDGDMGNFHRGDADVE